MLKPYFPNWVTLHDIVLWIQNDERDVKNKTVYTATDVSFGSLNHNAKEITFNGTSSKIECGALGNVKTIMNVEDIIDIIHAHDPRINVYVALCLPANDPIDSDITSYNTALNTMLLAKQSEKSNLFIVDHNTPIKANANWIADYFFDQYHMNDTGYAVMANTWYESLAENQ
jgi:lysophospholipase L1-like esterase